MHKNFSSQGFTLIEMLVGMFVFSIIILLVSSMFVSGLELQRRAFNVQHVEEHSTFILETMTKELRIAEITSPTVDTACPGTLDSSLTILHPEHGTITYALSGTDLTRTVKGVTGADVTSVLNSSSIKVARLGFCVAGVGIGDNRQPRVTVVATLTTVNDHEPASADIQTTLSSRLLSN